MMGINWIDFNAWVPEKVDTVFLAAGTIEAHGVGNNGADATVPDAIARRLAERLNGMVAPTIPYGVTNSLSAFGGGIRISGETFSLYAEEIIRELTRHGFKNIIVLNGHGPNFPYLEKVCAKISEETRVRTLVLDWWTLTGDITTEVYGSDGGHAGVNETAAIMATTPQFVRPEHFKKEMAWWSIKGASAYPFPSSIILYKPNEGYPDFDQAKAELFFGKVVDRLEEIVHTTIEKWNLAGL